MHFAHDEDGATTVDFVVLTAAAIGMAIAVMNTTGSGVHDHAERVEDKFVEQGVMTTY